MQYDKFKDVLFIHIPRTGGRSIQQVMVDSHAGVYANTPGQLHIEYEAGYLSEKFRYGNDWSTSWKFAIVRNPYDIEVSKFRARQAILAAAGRNTDKFTFKKFIDYTLGTEKNTPIGTETCNDTLPTCSCEFSNTASPFYIDSGGNTSCEAIIAAFNEQSKETKHKHLSVTDINFARGVLKNGQIPYLTTNTGVVVADTILYYEDLNNEWVNKVAVPKGYSNTISYRIANSTATPVDYREYYKDGGVANTAMIQLVANNYELDIDHLHYSWHMGPTTKPTAAWSTTIDTTSYPQFVFGVGASQLKPSERSQFSVNALKSSVSNTEVIMANVAMTQQSLNLLTHSVKTNNVFSTHVLAG